MSNALHQTFRFILVGTINTFIGLSIIFLAKGFFEFGDFASNLLGYSFGLVVSFFLNRNWTFRHNGHFVFTAIRFIIAFVVSYIANLATVYGLRDSIELNSYLAQAAGIIPYTLIFYLSCQYFVFPKNLHQ